MLWRHLRFQKTEEGNRRFGLQCYCHFKFPDTQVMSSWGPLQRPGIPCPSGCFCTWPGGLCHFLPSSEGRGAVRPFPLHLLLRIFHDSFCSIESPLAQSGDSPRPDGCLPPSAFVYEASQTAKCSRQAQLNYYLVILMQPPGFNAFSVSMSCCWISTLVPIFLRGVPFFFLTDITY